MERTVKYLFEAGMLKRVKRSGWWLCKISDPESVAEHSFRTAVVAFILARLEGRTDEAANKICSAAVFHDMHETRILDLHKIAAKYLDKAACRGQVAHSHWQVARGMLPVAREVEEDQINNLPKDIRQSLRNVLFNLSETERVILKDADLLEMALQAKEYLEIGYRDCEEWLVNIEKRLKTKSAKELMQRIKITKSSEWYAGLKKPD